MLRTVIFSIGFFILFSTNLYADLPEKFKSLSQKYSFNEANYGFAIQNLSNKTKKLEAIYTQKIADLEEMKKSVLQKAFSGQLNTIN